MTSPIGELLVRAEGQAKKKTGTRSHAADAPCGCRVSVSWFSEASRSIKMERCTEHEYPRDEKGRKR